MGCDVRLDRLITTVVALVPVPLLALAASQGQQPASQQGQSPVPAQQVALNHPVMPEAARAAEAARATVRPAKASQNPVAKATQPSVRPTPGDHRSAFLAQVAPIVKAENARILRDRARMQQLFERIEAGETLSHTDAAWLKSLAQRYRVKKDPSKHAGARTQLLIKVDSIPVELALAQAATESGWGRSRFAKEGLNLFGVWTYDKSKGLIPKGREEGATFLVRKYDSHTESVRHYLNLLNSHPAYRPLRKIRLTHRTSGKRPSGTALAEGLLSYSAKGQDYIDLIQKLIADHGLEQFRNV